MRQVLIDAFQLELYERMAASTDERLAAIAAKSVKEVRYHLRYSSGWLVRLGDGTEESHARVAVGARDASGPTRWNCSPRTSWIGRWPSRASRRGWPKCKRRGCARIDAILAEATLKRPQDRPHSWHGKRGQHSEHLGYMLAEMQHLQRTYPGARW